ncbi:hypothetical protein BC830DRAFT_1158938 [Chytriomyces sp. MP71]|nr:hypothetical protein BC830DRAFT_1158938 [Chytriomyces sp. MP71]
MSHSLLSKLHRRLSELRAHLKHLPTDASRHLQRTRARVASLPSITKHHLSNASNAVKSISFHNVDVSRIPTDQPSTISSNFISLQSRIVTQQRAVQERFAQLVRAAKAVSDNHAQSLTAIASKQLSHSVTSFASTRNLARSRFAAAGKSFQGTITTLPMVRAIVHLQGVATFQLGKESPWRVVRYYHNFRALNEVRKGVTLFAKGVGFAGAVVWLMSNPNY